MRRPLLGLLTVVALAAGATLAATPAQAAAKPVTIKKISNKSIGWDGAALVRPNVAKAKKVRIVRKAMTISQGGTVVRKNRTAVKLRPGSYRVTTKVTYVHRGKKRVATARQSLVVRQGRCATARDARTLKADPAISADVVGDSVATVSTKLRSSGRGASYTPEELIVVLGFFKKMMVADMPELAGVFDVAIAEVRAMQAKGVKVLEDRTYAGCGGAVDVYATFADGELYSAEDDADIFANLTGGPAALRALGR